MGIRPRLTESEFPDDVMGFSMASYYGGRTEVRIRRCDVPVVHTDFTSMYSTVNTLMQLNRFVVAERVEAVESTTEVRAMLDSITADGCFDPSRWPSFNGIALIEPEGDILPVRGEYGDTWNIGLNHYISEPQWFAIPDLVNAKILGGKAPRVLRAICFVPIGVQAGLKRVKLFGTVPIDPRRDDVFKKVIEERIKVKRGRPPYDRLTKQERDTLQWLLKVVANSGSYGIYAEVREESLDGVESFQAYGERSFTLRSNRISVPGAWFFAPMATVITAAARLMLGLLEHEVTSRGGSYALCDTDSMMIVATKHGMPIQLSGAGRDGKRIAQNIRAMAWSDVQGIVQRFEALNPYDRTIVPGSVLKIEDDNYSHCGLPGHDRDERNHSVHCACTKFQRQLWCHAISSKRYCLFVKSRRKNDVVEGKESGFGFMLNPNAAENEEEVTKLAKAFWEAHINGRPIHTLPWSEYPAVRQVHASTPHVLRRLEGIGGRTTPATSIRPSSFLIEISARTGNIDESVHPLIAPFERAPGRWYELPWYDAHRECEPWRLMREDDFSHWDRETGLLCRPSGNHAVARTIADFCGAYVDHPEYTFLGPDGEPCSYQTRGWLKRRTVTRLLTKYTNKEGQPFEEDPEFESSWAEVHIVAADDRLWDRARAVLADMPRHEVARALSISARTITEWVSKRTQPMDCSEAIRYAVSIAADRMGCNGASTGLPAAVLGRYTEWRTQTMSELSAQLQSMSVSMISRTFGAKASDARRMKTSTANIRLLTALQMLKTRQPRGDLLR